MIWFWVAWLEKIDKFSVYLLYILNTYTIHIYVCVVIHFVFIYNINILFWRNEKRPCMIDDRPTKPKEDTRKCWMFFAIYNNVLFVSLLHKYYVGVTKPLYLLAYIYVIWYIPYTYIIYAFHLYIVNLNC